MWMLLHSSALMMAVMAFMTENLFQISYAIIQLVISIPL